MKLRLLLILSLLVSISFAQGVIYKKADAEKNYGIVMKSSKPIKKDIYSAASKTSLSTAVINEKQIGFKFIDDDILVYDQEEVNKIDIFGNVEKYLIEKRSVKPVYYFGQSKVHELITLGGTGELIFEERKEINPLTGEPYFTITSGDYTLQMSNPCPPHCPGTIGD